MQLICMGVIFVAKSSTQSVCVLKHTDFTEYLAFLLTVEKIKITTNSYLLKKH